MTKEHKIRICVSHLKGAEREAEILRLLKSRSQLRLALNMKLGMIRRKTKTR